MLITTRDGWIMLRHYGVPPLQVKATWTPLIAKSSAFLVGIRRRGCPVRRECAADMLKLVPVLPPADGRRRRHRQLESAKTVYRRELATVAAA